MDPTKLVDAINISTHKTMTHHLGYATSAFVYGVYRGAETVDGDLSMVELTSSTDLARFVPRIDSDVVFSNGDTLLMVHGANVPLTIIGRVIGNITLAG